MGRTPYGVRGFKFPKHFINHLFLPVALRMECVDLSWQCNNVSVPCYVALRMECVDLS